MKTYGYRAITKSLPIGIRRFSKNSVNRPGLSTCYNLVPTETGLASPELPVLPPTSQYTETQLQDIMRWPLPQLFELQSYTFGIHVDTVFQVTGKGTGAWSFRNIPLVNSHALGEEGQIIGRDVWHVADNGDAFVMTNGHTALFKTPLLGKMWGYDDDMLLTNNATPFSTCARHMGRTVLGGFDGNTWTQAWNDIFDDMRDDLPDGVMIPNVDLKQNMVLWGPVGGSIYWLFYGSTFATNGPLGAGTGYDETRRYVMDLFRKNDMGWMALPFSGKVLQLAPLGQYLVAYGTNGSVALHPLGSPVSTYGLVGEVGPGTLQRGSVGVSPYGHLYIDNEGYLRFKTPELKDIRLGYQEIFSDTQWLARNTVVTWNENAKEWYIANGQQGYCLKMNAAGTEILGLGEINRLYTSVISSWGQTYGLYEKIGHDEAIFRSNELTFEGEGLKTIQSVDVGTKGLSQDNVVSGLVRVHYKFSDEDQEFEVGEWIPLNEQGQAVVMQGGKRFMVEVALDNDGEVEVDRCDVWIQFDDNRFRRGIYVD